MAKQDGNRPRNIDPTRPIPELYIYPERRFERMESSAKQINIAANVPLERWYTAANQVYDNCSYYMINNQVENAYMQAARIIYISKEGFPTHPQYNEYTSEARTRLESVLPEVIRLEERLRKEIIAVYNIQAAYYQYEEEQRQLRLENRQLWLANQEERTAKSAELFAAAEHHSHQLKMDIGRILPLSIEPDFMHAMNPRPKERASTQAAQPSPKPKSSSGERPFWEDPKSAPVRRAWDRDKDSPSTSKTNSLKVSKSRRGSSSSSISSGPYPAPSRTANRYFQRAPGASSSIPGTSGRIKRPDGQHVGQVSPEIVFASVANESPEPVEIRAELPNPAETQPSTSGSKPDAGNLKITFEGVEIDLGVIAETRETWPEWPPSNPNVVRSHAIQSPPMLPGTSEVSAFRHVGKSGASKDGPSGSNG